jgi:hypothetical protein
MFGGMPVKRTPFSVAFSSLEERREKEISEWWVTKKVPTASVLGSYPNIYHSSRPAA